MRNNQVTIAATNFLNALEKIPGIIEQHRKSNEVLEQEIPQLQAIAGKEWKKEDELKLLKSELAALDRKIQLELAPPVPDKTEENTPNTTQTAQPVQKQENPHKEFRPKSILCKKARIDCPKENKEVKINHF